MRSIAVAGGAVKKATDGEIRSRTEKTSANAPKRRQFQMSRQNWTIGKRIGIGFGMILVMLCIASILSYSGVGRIVQNAGEVIEGIKLDGLLAQREVDHLNWANQVNALLTDNQVTELKAQTDPTQCAFGKWLYGEARKATEALLPVMAPLLKQIDSPHQALHATAVEIGWVSRQAESELGGFLHEKKIEHLRWLHHLKDVSLNPEATAVDLETDHTRCNLGRWICAESTRVLKTADTDFAKGRARLEAPHQKLHARAQAINAMLSRRERPEAIRHYSEQTQPLAEETLAAIRRLVGLAGGAH
jgi:methyl-accepting chemotaxis protein